MITVETVRFTSQPTAWHRFAEVLGLRAAFPPQAGWSEYEAGGVLAVHEVAAGDPLDGTTEMHLLVSDLDAFAEAGRVCRADIQETEPEDVGRLVRISLGAVRISASAGAHATSGDPSVLPIQYVPELTVADALYRSLGLTSRLASDSQVWSDYAADGGGLAALHQGEPHIELAFEYAGDLDGLAARLQDAGYESEIVDEAYNRTLQVVGPGGEQLWVNGAQRDLYGYRLLS